MSVEKHRHMFEDVARLPQSPERYGEVIYGFNMLIHAELQQALEGACRHLRGVEALAIPGSDGRFEKGSIMSQVEIIALLPEGTHGNIETLKRSVSEAVRRVSPTRIAHFEWKQFGTPLTAFNGDRNRIQPARIATDARPVWGSKDAVERARKQVGHEVVGADGQRIREKVAGLERDARRAITGKNKFAGGDAVHFELDNPDGTGQIFFNPKAHQLSFKIGPLRLVQSTLLAESIKHIRRENDVEFLSTLRSNISRRLQQLKQDKMLNISQESVNAIIEHYNYFLRLYHMSEQAYLNRKQTVIAIGPAEVYEIKRRLVELSHLMSSVKIGRVH